MSLDAHRIELEKNILHLYKTSDTLLPTDLESIGKTIDLLNEGKLRVCEKINGHWITHEWLKMAILLYFKTQKISPFKAGDFNFYDKIPLKRWNGNENVRSVPMSLVRKGAFIEANSILMPSYVNIGAYVGAGSMIDTWATVGSCAQIGRNVHLSGGVGIGGVLEPPQAQPVIVEDNAFIGSRSILVEGVLVEEGAVIGAGTTITASTKIIDVTQKDRLEYKGRIPKNSVVIPGTYDKNFPAGSFGVSCALIIGQRKESTDLKTSLNEVLRTFSVPV